MEKEINGILYIESKYNELSKNFDESKNELSKKNKDQAILIFGEYFLPLTKETTYNDLIKCYIKSDDDARLSRYLEKLDQLIIQISEPDKELSKLLNLIYDCIVSKKSYLSYIPPTVYRKIFEYIYYRYSYCVENDEIGQNIDMIKKQNNNSKLKVLK